MRLTKTHRAYFEAARSVAQLSDFPRIKIGAVATYKHRIVSSGFNSRKTDPLQKKYNVYRFEEETPHCVHAELICLKPLIGRDDIDFRHVDLYIHRSNKDGAPLLARPCRSCEKLIRDLKIRKVFFSTYGGYASEEFYDMGE